MTSQTVSNKFMPPQFVAKPNFQRGSMGRDISQGSGGGSPVPGPVIDRNCREGIQNYSKDAHFKFTAHRKLSLLLINFVNAVFDANIAVTISFCF
jgi:hypothetical protein